MAEAPHEEEDEEVSKKLFRVIWRGRKSEGFFFFRKTLSISSE